HYDGDLARSLNVPSAVAGAIADRLHATITPAEKSLLDAPVFVGHKAEALEKKGAAADGAAWYNKKNPYDDWLLSERYLREAALLDPNCDNVDCVNAYDELIFVEFNLWRTSSGKKGAWAYRASLGRWAFDNSVRRTLQFDAGRSHEAQSTYYFYFLRDYEKSAQDWEKWHPTITRGAFWIASVDRRRGRWADSIRRFAEYEEDHPDTVPCARETAKTLGFMRKYREAEECLRTALDKALAGAAEYYTQLGEMRLAQADPDGADAFFARTLDELRRNPKPSIYSEKRECLGHQITAALYRRDYRAGLQLVASAPDDFEDEARKTFDPSPHLQPWLSAQFDRMENGATNARNSFATAHEELSARWGDSEAIAGQMSILACLAAGAGRKDEAIRDAKRALAMRPIERDAQDGPYLATNLALVYAWTGEYDLAIEQLQKVAAIPCGPSYGDLKLNPKWDDLRSDPRFEAMVASLKPNNGQ
ncbi:MAG: tetratricopeptide repeat protein, partial [Chthoniobacterales bacterium]